MTFVKHAALQFQQLRAKRLAEVEKAEKVIKWHYVSIHARHSNSIFSAEMQFPFFDRIKKTMKRKVWL